MFRCFVAALPLILMLSPAGAFADELPRDHQGMGFDDATGGRTHSAPVPFPTPLWVATQLMPNFSMATGAGEVSLDLRWQLTPLLYAWGVNRRVSGWRSFVVEPNFRYGGSVEFFVSPELLLAERTEFFLRPGIRAYFPAAEYGEALSLSLGLSYQRVGRADAVAVEAGAYILFGILGLQVSYAPGPSTPAQMTATLQLRYF